MYKDTNILLLLFIIIIYYYYYYYYYYFSTTVTWTNSQTLYDGWPFFIDNIELLHGQTS
jgi:hypothetical protein